MLRCLALAIAIAIPVGTASADYADCQRSIDRYVPAAAEVDRAARSYIACIWSSRGRDDCSSAFDRLSSARDRYEDVVGDYKEDCR